MRTRLVDWTTAVLTVVVAATSAGATGYYVSSGDGNDSWPGTRQQPWATLARSVTGVGPGDSLYIRGTFREQLVLRRSGTALAPIAYTAWPGDSAILDGAGAGLTYNRATRFGMVQIAHASYLRVSELRIRNSPFFGVGMRDAAHVVIEGNRIYNTVYSGIITWEESDSANPSAKGGHRCISILRNEVELACNDGPQECISLWGTDTFEVAYNHVHHGGPGSQGAEGIDVKCGSRFGSIHHNYVHHMNRQGIYVDACSMVTSDIDVYANVVHDCVKQDGFDIGSETGGTLRSVRIFNNLAYNNGCNGLRIASWGTVLGPIRNILVINNTFVANGTHTWGNRGGISVEANTVDSIILRNNIVSDNVQFQIFVAPQAAQRVTVDHNLIKGFRGFAGETRGTQFVEGDPVFAGETSGVFLLQPSSPARDAGSAALAPLFDIDSIARPQGDGYDIGAYEFTVTGATAQYANGSGKPKTRNSRLTCNGEGLVMVSDCGGRYSSVSYDLRGRIMRARR